MVLEKVPLRLPWPELWVQVTFVLVTKDLQHQYARDFPYLKVAEGMNNFPCLVKEDFIRIGNYECKTCRTLDTGLDGKRINPDECDHKMVNYGKCKTEGSFKNKGYAKRDESGCRYRTFLEDYQVTNVGKIDEQILLNRSDYEYYFENWGLEEKRTHWQPCEYYHQLNTALAASHSLFNYSNLLAFLSISARSDEQKSKLPRKSILILDEGHMLETEVIKFRGLAISKRRYRKYIYDLKIKDHGYDHDNLGDWLEFLVRLANKIQDLFDSDSGDNKTPRRLSEELRADAENDLRRLDLAIRDIKQDPNNWIVAKIDPDTYGDNDDNVAKVEFKPLDVSPYCSDIFAKCSKTLIMSATILNKDVYCRSVGLEPEEVKFIRVPSDFPVVNRPIYPCRIAYLNYRSMREPKIMSKIAQTIDFIMTKNAPHKGIIHTTSYQQLKFIRDNISKENSRRLIESDPERPRIKVIEDHIQSSKPSVLISPSLHTGLDLKDGLSRFQIITKIPYPTLGDRWINAKRLHDPEWYDWQTALKLIQAYGRSVRSKDDWAKTYILDAAFELFMDRNKSTFPEWFLEAVQVFDFTTHF